MNNPYAGLFTPKQRTAFARIAAELEKLRKLVPMDNKYGHLFTAEDMLAFARIVSESGVELSDDGAIDEMLDDFEGRFPKDEPLFLVRAQDRRGLSCVRNYRTMINYSGGIPAPGMITGLDAVVTEFEDFQRDHPDRMKDAD